ncbi:PAS domain S-box protein [uncultured Thiodictyon sp.]|jgi:PAS domain S-box-containing protein|uniref:PAS domain S-box protein n=1 Tax=uncultured Thiodictyon sp. TaxID=1846217 RepID=UPI0025D96C92|nr:PAS domain S-box protein [uncultured Thiodictyon sp.]
MTASATPLPPPAGRPYTGRRAWVTALAAKVSLRTLLVVTFTLLAIGAAGTVGMLSYQAGRQAVTTLANQLMAEIGARVDQRLAWYLSGLRNIVETNAVLIRQGRLAADDTAGLQGHFAAQLGLSPGVDSIGLVTARRDMLMLARGGPDALIIRRCDAATGYRLHHYRADPDGRPGELIESRDNYDPHNDPPGKPWYPAVRESGQGSWRLSVSLAKGQDHPALVTFFALPFDDGRGAVQGVLVAGMTLSGIGEFLQGLQVSAHGRALLLDRDGLLVATSTGETPFDSRARTEHGQNVAVETRRLAASASTDAVTREAARHLSALQPALGQLRAPLRFDFAFNGQRYLAQVAAAAPQLSHPDWLTLVIAPQRDFTDLIAAHLHRPVLLAGLTLVTAVLLGLVAADAISRPLRQLTAATRRLAEGDFAQSLPPAPIRDLRELGESFGKMTLRLRDAFGELHQLNQTLRVAEGELAGQNQQLERRVAARTAELVAAQVRVEDALAQVAESETKYRTIFEQSPLGIGLTDSQTGRLLECNRRFGEILGRTPVQLAATDWMSITHPDDLSLDEGQMTRMNAGESAGFEMDKRYLRPDGAVVSVHLTVAPLTLRARGMRCHLGLVEDITARKQAETELRQSEARLRSYFEQPLVGIAITSLDKGWLEINDRLCTILGYTRDELRRKTWTELTHPDDLTADVAEFERVLRGELDSYSLEKRFVRADGRVVPTDISVACIRGPDARPEYFVALIQDVTERRRAAEALRESEEKFRLAFDNANTGMCLVDLEGRLFQVNDKMTAIFGYAKAELEGMTVNDLAYPDDLGLSRQFIDHAVHGTGDSATFEKRYRHRQGRLIYGAVASSLVRDAQGQPRYFISQVQDITDRKHAERELAQARDAAETANRAKGEFLAHMSHEIRTPMNVVLGLAQVLNREPLTPTQHDMVGRIQTAGQSLLVIINDILDLSKIEAEQLRLEPRPFVLGALLERIDTMMAPGARAKGLVLRVAAAPTALTIIPATGSAAPPCGAISHTAAASPGVDRPGRTGVRRSQSADRQASLAGAMIKAPPAVPGPSLGPLLGDALRLEQVLVNLIGNAVKFTERGEVTVSVYTIQSDAASERLRFAVRDTGIGIPSEALDRLFTPFTQAEEGITRRFGGTGLGLAISKRLVALMGGEIGVASRVGEGSTFWFELSLARASAADGVLAAVAPLGGAVSPAGAPRLAGAHFLLVDDSAMNRDLVERALALEGATATLAADGQQALQVLSSRPGAFDAVLMDVRMPVMDGLTATRLIRGELGLTDLPVIALTAGVLAEEREAARAAGVNAFLPKPLDLEQLTAVLLNWVNPRPAAPDADTAAAPGEPTPAAAPVRGQDAVGGFPDIEGIDRARAGQLMPDRDLFLRALGWFADEHGQTADRAALDLAQGERASAARRMHNLRAGAGQLGAADLAALAGALEAAIERGETGLEGRLAALGRQVADLLAASAPWREAARPGTPAPAAAPPPPLDAERLAALREDLRRRNLQARQGFEDLRPALAGVLGEAGAEALGRAIHGLRYAQALAALDEAAAGSNRDPRQETNP